MMRLLRVIEKALLGGVMAGIALTTVQWILATKLAEGPSADYVLVLPRYLLLGQDRVPCSSLGMSSGRERTSISRS